MVNDRFSSIVEENLTILNKYFQNSKYLELNILNQEEASEFLDYFIKTSFVRTTSIIFNTKKSQENLPPNVIFRSPHQAAKTNIIVGNTLEILEQYFENHEGEILQHRRCLYILILLSYKQERFVSSLLRKLWVEKRILNAILYIPCEKNFMYIYRPFEVRNNQYGVIEKSDCVGVRKSPLLVLNNVKNLNGFPLKVSIFSRGITALLETPKCLKNYRIYDKIPYTSGMYGFDGVLTSEISLALNFTVSKIEGFNEFGVVYNKSSATGTAGQILRNEADLQGNPRFVTWSSLLNFVEYTEYFAYDQLCVVVSKSVSIPKWIGPFINIKSSVWIGLLMILIVSTLFNHILTPPSQRKLMNSWIEVFGVSISQCLPRFTKKTRIFSIIVLFGSINISSLFNATMYKAYTIESYYPDIKTLEELDRSNLEIKGSLKPFANSFYEIYQSLDRKTSSNYRGSALDSVVRSGKRFAAFERYHDANILLRSKYVNKDGTPMLHLIPECPVYYYLSLIVPKSSPFLAEINLVITRLREGGFNIKWYNDFADALVYEKLINVSTKENHLKALNISDIQISIYILFVGYFVSLLVLCGEILMF
ncbi:uncharacterized protein LOC115878646 [Sitophilus oryzae]|uniref:Uncharacterized protein LOC115878646 n=1 Tax=Sitophilus oryzae TaxID=7048 RepID=A0A6J2XJF2_SITOR|nr:uncharacterized protein LOC115878646 [Sitophilus oryzae]